MSYKGAIIGAGIGIGVTAALYILAYMSNDPSSQGINGYLNFIGGGILPMMTGFFMGYGPTDIEQTQRI